MTAAVEELIALNNPGPGHSIGTHALIDARNFPVFTVREGRIVVLRDCRDRQEALMAAGIDH